MGCEITKEKIELDMLMLKLKRTEIKDQRKQALNLYKRKTGKTLIRAKIPDYIDHKAMHSITQNKKCKTHQLASDSSLKVNYSTKLTASTENNLCRHQTSPRNNENELQISEIPSLMQIES